MISVGAHSLFPMEKLAVRGYVEVLRHYLDIRGIQRKLKTYFLANPPDLFIGIDAPDFNLSLEEKLKASGIPTIHYVSPSIWAWRGERIHKIARSVSHMLVVFPFEPPLYEKAGVPVTYVGHPLADILPMQPDRAAARVQLNLPQDATVIAMLPGSDPARASEYVLVGAHNDHVGTNPIAVDHDSLRAVNTVTRRQGANDAVCTPTPEQQKKIDSLIAAARKVRPPRRDSIMNGADDDGSGTVVMLEIAEQFAAEKPARSIIFVSHQGEESGLLGSAWFVEHPTVPLTSIVAAHNMDMVGKGRVEQVKFGGPASVQMLGSRRLSREFGDIIDSVNATRVETMAIDKSWDVTANPLNRFCRSDQVMYVLKDIPVTYFSLGYAQDYHQPTDEPQYIEYDHSARLGRFIHDVMMAIATRKDRPAIAGPDPSFPQCGR